MAYLVVLAGFAGSWERVAARLRSRFKPHEVEFLGRDRPGNWEAKKFLYRDALTQDVVERIFGKGEQYGFCSKDGHCSVGQEKWSRATCRRDVKEQVACRRNRPDLLILVCPDVVFDMMFDKFGRAALLLTVDDEMIGEETLSSLLDAYLPVFRNIKNYLSNLPQSNYAPRLPLVNFQDLGGHAIAQDAQKDLTKFQDTMEHYHKSLSSPLFRNKRRPYMRGAYMLDHRIGFQRDLLHSSAQVGCASRQDGYHLLNAFHMYGLAISPGWHFDVSRHEGGEVGYEFRDVLTGDYSTTKDMHVDITPDDRIV